jgi:hypothetical protein
MVLAMGHATRVMAAKDRLKAAKRRRRDRRSALIKAEAAVSRYESELVAELHGYDLEVSKCQ